MLQGTAVLLAVVGLGLVGHQNNDVAWIKSLAEPGTPGTPIQIDVVVFEADGKTPVVGARVEVYHNGPWGYPDDHEHRFEGFLRTNAEGRFRFSSVRPAPYPDTAMPAHIHVIIRPAEGPRRFLELRFAGDPNLSRSQVRLDRARGDYGFIQALKEDENGVHHGHWKIRLDVLSAI